MGWLHHSAARDYQRTRVYSAESMWRTANHGTRDWHGPLLTMQQATLVSELVADEMQLAYAPEVKGIKGGGGHAGYDWRTTAVRHCAGEGFIPVGAFVGLGTYANGKFSTGTLLHELAHCVMFFHTLPDTTSSHGPLFAGCHAAIIAAYYDARHADALQDLYTMKRAKAAQWRDVREAVEAGTMTRLVDDVRHGRARKLNRCTP